MLLVVNQADFIVLFFWYHKIFPAMFYESTIIADELISQIDSWLSSPKRPIPTDAN